MPHFIAIDLTQDPGDQLAPEVKAEIVTVAPSAVTNGSITTLKLDNLSVTRPKIALAAVATDQIDVGGVETDNLGPEAVTTPKLAIGAVTPVKCGIGVVTAVDSADSDIETIEKYVTAAQYAAISTPDPNTTYFISA